MGKQAVTLGCDYLPTNMHCRLETIAVQVQAAGGRVSNQLISFDQRLAGALGDYELSPVRASSAPLTHFSLRYPALSVCTRAVPPPPW